MSAWAKLHPLAAAGKVEAQGVVSVLAALVGYAAGTATRPQHIESRRHGPVMDQPRHAFCSHVPSAIDSMTRGFQNDPFYEWMFPDPDTSSDYVRTIMTMYAEWSLQVGYAWTLGDNAIGSACWVPADVEPNEQFETTYMTAAVGANPDRSEVVIEGLMEVGAVHPEESHWYLAAVAVLPRRGARARAGTARSGTQHARC